MAIEYGIEKSLILTPDDWAAINARRAETPDNPQPTDEELWLDEIGQYRCMVQSRIFDYIDEHNDGLLRDMPGGAQATLPFVAIRPLISETLWEQWRALGMPLDRDIFDPDVTSMSDIDVESYNPDFRDIVEID